MFFQCSKTTNNISLRPNLLWRGHQPSPFELCDKLEKLLQKDDCSPEEQDRRCVVHLRSITAWIRNNHPSNEDLICIGGRGSCVLRCLAETAMSGRWHVATATLQLLLELAEHLPKTGTGESKASSIAGGVQQSVTQFLQLHQQSPSIGHGEAVCLALRVSHAMLLLAPASLLPATFLAACRPYLFYGLPSYRSAVQDNSGGFLLQEELDSLQSSECDQAAMTRPNYNNRNRRKRLRRKKTQPGSTVSKDIPSNTPLRLSDDLPSAAAGSPLYRNRTPFHPTRSCEEQHSLNNKAGYGGDRTRQPFNGLLSSRPGAAMPSQFRSPDPSELNSLCLKPQWVMRRDRKGTNLNPQSISEAKTDGHLSSAKIIGEVQTTEDLILHDKCEQKSRDIDNNSVSSTSEINPKFSEHNICKPIQSKSDFSADSTKEVLTIEKCANNSTDPNINEKSGEEIMSSNILDDLQGNQSNSRSGIEKIGNEDITTSIKLNDNNSNGPPNNTIVDGSHNNDGASSLHCRPEFSTFGVDDESNKNCSSSDEDESSQPRVGSRSLLTARVRQAALAAVSALVTVVGPAGKMALWAPLLCQSPSLLHCLLTEQYAPGRAAMLALLSLLLTDARQPLSQATDRMDRTAYSSLCYQLGSSLREMHTALAKVLVCEQNSEAIVRTLKVLELLLDNVTYSKLAPGLLSRVVRMVRPYISHSEAVVRANALSVLVSVLLVKPAQAEVPEMLLRYSPPGPRTNAVAAVAAEAVLAHFTASSEDTAAEWEEEEEEVLLEQNTQEEIDVLSAVQALNIETSSKSASNVSQAAPPCPAISNPSRRTLLGWLVGQCVDALLPPPPSPHGNSGSSRGVYVQVQLQSLKVLHALVTDHFSLVYSRLPVLQRIISHGCRASSAGGGGPDIAESGVVVEHMFPLLGAVLAVLKKECDDLLKTDASEGEGGLGHHSCLVRREEEWRDGRLGATPHLKTAAQTDVNTRSAIGDEEGVGPSGGNRERRSSGRRRNRELGGAVNLSDISWLPLSTSLWQWAMQDPLRDLLLLPIAAGAAEGPKGSSVGAVNDSNCRASRVFKENIQGAACTTTSSREDVSISQDDPAPEEALASATSWYHALQGTGEVAEGARRQLVAAANTLSLLSQQVAEGIGEQHLSSVLTTVLWLTNDSQPEVVAVWGVRVVGALCSLPAVQRSPLALEMVTSAVVAGTRLLQDSAGPAAVATGRGGIAGKRSEPPFVFESVALGSKFMFGNATAAAQQNIASDQQQTAAAVNKHRLVAVSALANIAASLKNYSPSVPGGAVLPRDVTECLLEAAIVACDDKSKIRPHGVRCLGSALGWLREVAFRETPPKTGVNPGKYLPSQAVTWLELSPGLCERALATLVECCSNGNNMKMRWNACHALGHLLHCPLPIAGSQEWRGPVLALLCSLVSGFPNYKVRIQAGLALCGLPSRDLYGAHYRSAWRALLAAATSSRNVTDYLEMRHLDDLVCQVVKGMWQLTALATIADCAWLRPLLLEQMACLTLLLRRALSCLPPHCCAAQERALQHVTDLMDSSDVLTDDQVAGLRLLENLFGENPASLPDDLVTAALLDGSTAFLTAPSTKTLP